MYICRNVLHVPLYVYMYTYIYVCVIVSCMYICRNVLHVPLTPSISFCRHGAMVDRAGNDRLTDRSPGLYQGFCQGRRRQTERERDVSIPLLLLLLLSPSVHPSVHEFPCQPPIGPSWLPRKQSVSANGMLCDSRASISFLLVYIYDERNRNFALIVINVSQLIILFFLL